MWSMSPYRVIVHGRRVKDWVFATEAEARAFAARHAGEHVVMWKFANGRWVDLDPPKL